MHYLLVAGLVPLAPTLSTRGLSAPLRGGRATLAAVSPSPVSSRPPSEGAQPGKSREAAPPEGKLVPDSWLDNWYPVMFTADVPADSPVAAQVFERPLVLYRDEEGLQCLADTCPHQLAPLSEGRLAVDASSKTRLECSYHGWQFAGCGKCTKLPQLEGTKPILPLYGA